MNAKNLLLNYHAAQKLSSADSIHRKKNAESFFCVFSVCLLDQQQRKAFRVHLQN
jgi:hypothetical protein